MGMTVDQAGHQPVPGAVHNLGRTGAEISTIGRGPRNGGDAAILDQHRTSPGPALGADEGSVDADRDRHYSSASSFNWRLSAETTGAAAGDKVRRSGMNRPISSARICG